MIAQSPATTLAVPQPIATPRPFAVTTGLLAAVAAFIERAARTPSELTSSERYWTSVGRGL